MDLKDFGRQFKEERVRQGLDLLDVVEKTKISRISLEAIEEGNARALPHPVYAKGFVKNYARFLGMDADKMGNLMAQIHGSDDMPESDEQIALANARKLPAVKPGFSRHLVFFIAGLVVVLLLAGAWVFRSTIQDTLGFFFKIQEESVQAVPQVHPEMPQEAAQLPGVPSGAVDDSMPGDPGTGAEEMSQVDGQAIEAQSPASEGSAYEDVPPPTVEVSAHKRTLEVRAFQNCWLAVQIDEGREREAYLRPGERFSLEFAKSLDLKLGNAGGVELFLDGRPWPLHARPGEVRIIRLP